MRAIWSTFVSPGVIAELGNSAKPRDFYVGLRRRKRLRNGEFTEQPRFLKLTDVYILQGLAVYYLICARKTVLTSARDAIVDARRQLLARDKKLTMANTEILLKVIQNILFSYKLSDDLSANYQKAVLSLGESVAGDEKLWKFTGNSGNLKLVISKPDRIGFWNFQLCCMFKSNTTELPFMLDSFCDMFALQTTGVGTVMERWIKVIKSVGSEVVPPIRHMNPRAVLYFDSY